MEGKADPCRIAYDSKPAKGENLEDYMHGFFCIEYSQS
jgi:hypothetical protein